MGVEKVEKLANRTIISIHEPTRYGEPDVFREIVVPHDPTYRSELPTISRGQLETPLDDLYGGGVEKMETVQVEHVGTLVFVNSYDTETSSATYRSGSHRVLGPYLLDEQ